MLPLSLNIAAKNRYLIIMHNDIFIFSSYIFNLANCYRKHYLVFFILCFFLQIFIISHKQIEAHVLNNSCKALLINYRA